MSNSKQCTNTEIDLDMSPQVHMFCLNFQLNLVVQHNESYLN
jgi:hypothetical protein